MGSFYTNIQLAGNTILYRGYEDGQQVQSRTHFSPTLFVTSNKKEKFKTLTGEYVKPIQFESPREAREFIAKYEGVENFSVYGYERYVYQFIAKEFPGEIDYDMKQMKIFSMDIEVACENGFPDVEASAEEMLCITIKDMNTKEVFVWGTREFNPPEGVEFFVFWTEQEMLNHFVRWWAENTPDVLTGWNVNLYDVPYICRRVNRVLGEKWMKTLSPWNRANEREINIMGRTHIAYDLSGINILDYLDLYKKFTYTNQESYRLDHIAFVELGQRKLDHSEYENFKDFYTSDWQKFVEYNIQDVELIDRLEDKMKLIELAVTMAYDAKVNLEDVYSQVRMWDTMIYNYLKDRNLVVPPRKGAKKDEKYAGAYVKEPVPGMYEWVVSFDLNSLYPHLIMQYNISPETLVDVRHPQATVDRLLNQEIDIDGEYCVCANGAQYRKDILGFLPEMMQKIYDERTIYKKRMLAAKQDLEHSKTTSETIALQKDVSKFNNIQMARKIQLNSAYGAIGNQYFRYYNLANAEAITLSGQVSIRWIENKINGYLNKLLKTKGKDYVIASDTDSIYLCLDLLVRSVFDAQDVSTERIVKFLDAACQKQIEPFIERSYQELATYVNAYENKMFMKRENIANRGIWTRKKRYILNVWNSEGVQYHEPKLKIMGIEAIKSSTPSSCRTALREALKIIMSGTQKDLQSFVSKFEKDFKTRPLDEISFPRSCNNIGQYHDPVLLYGHHCPIHVRGALLYNHQIKKKKLANKYPLIQEGEKIKYIFLKTPNKLGRAGKHEDFQNVISFFRGLPPEFGVDEYIDYDTQFEKAFLDPLSAILKQIGWTARKRNTLEFMFR